MKISEILEDIIQPIQPITESLTPQDALSLIGKEAVIDYINTKPVRLLGGKKNEMVGRVTKINRNWPVKFIAPGEYGEMMRQQPGQEEFQSKPGWGTPQENGLIEKDGKMIIQAVSTGRSETTFLFDGKPIAKEDIIGMPPPAPRPEGQVPVVRLEIDKIQVVQVK